MFTATVSVPHVTAQDLAGMRPDLVKLYGMKPVAEASVAVREAARSYKTSSQAECVIVEKSSAVLSADGKTWTVSLYVFD